MLKLIWVFWLQCKSFTFFTNTTFQLWTFSDIATKFCKDVIWFRVTLKWTQKDSTSMSVLMHDSATILSTHTQKIQMLRRKSDAGIFWCFAKLLFHRMFHANKLEEMSEYAAMTLTSLFPKDQMANFSQKLVQKFKNCMLLCCWSKL